MALRMIQNLLKALGRLEWLPILLARLSAGGLFFESGRGKLFHTLEEFKEFFHQLGIPYPDANAVFVASTEFVGGLCLIIGFATRLMSIPLAVIMVVAIATSQIKTVHTLGDFLYLPEVFLFVICVWLVFSSPGKVSIDRAIARRFGTDE